MEIARMNMIIEAEVKRLPGQYYDAETNLHYNYFRDYDPGTGRYIQSDPIGLMGGLNLYVYVTNNALRSIDPLGLYGVDPFSDKHINRNRNNRCPAKEPNPTDCEGNYWSPDIVGGFYAHGRFAGFKTYRLLDTVNPPGGFQCTYHPDGTVDTTTDFRGTYDYVSPEFSVGGHQAYDVEPHRVNPSYENPDKTQIYCTDCE
jgi:RHS repeat-associated protein